MDLSTFEIIVNTLLIIIGVYQIVLSLLHKMDLISKSMVTGYCALGSLLLGLGLLSLGLIEHLGSTFFLVPLIYLLPLCFGIHFTQKAKYTKKA